MVPITSGYPQSMNFARAKFLDGWQHQRFLGIPMYLNGCLATTHMEIPHPVTPVHKNTIKSSCKVSVTVIPSQPKLECADQGWGVHVTGVSAAYTKDVSEKVTNVYQEVTYDIHLSFWMHLMWQMTYLGSLNRWQGVTEWWHMTVWDKKNGVLR
jgi:hypothetical protein